MATKSYTDISQSRKLAEILPLESADMWWTALNWQETEYYVEVKQDGINQPKKAISCWSFTALYAILPEINGVSPKIEKVKAEDGYNGYYYPIEYEGIVLIPYSKNPVDACYELIIRLHELNLL